MNYFGELFTEMRREDVPVAKFRIGEKVTYVGCGCVVCTSNFLGTIGQKYLITGINCNMLLNLKAKHISESWVPHIEYSLLGFPFQVREEELLKSEKEAHNG